MMNLSLIHPLQFDRQVQENCFLYSNAPTWQILDQNLINEKLFFQLLRLIDVRIGPEILDFKTNGYEEHRKTSGS